MTIRFSAAPVSTIATVALVCGASLASTGCGKYSWSTLSAVKSFKDGNVEYARKDWKKAADRFEDVVENQKALAQAPVFIVAYFFLANSYDQLY
jgi:hypothetical protein